ncbi:MAG: Uma2 family endonuclease [Alkalispirochaetaceae bacterium]
MADAQRHQRISWKEYLSSPRDERFELIDGEPYAMSPAPRREHQRLLAELTRQVANALQHEPCDVYPAPFDVKLSPQEADQRPTVVQPDLTVVCDETKLTEQGVTGPPDLVVEIVSPDTGFHDRGRKFDLYERYGVSEYWIVDPSEKLIEVYRLEHSRYLRAGVSGPADTLTSVAVPAITLTLSALFPPASAG